MEWRWFWIALAVFVGLNNIKRYTSLADITVISPLKEIVFFGKFISFVLMAYILLGKCGVIKYLKDKI